MAKAKTIDTSKPMKIKESTGYRIFTVCNTILMVIICVVMLYPFVYLVAQSFSSAEAILAGKVSLLPVDFSVETYAYVIQMQNYIFVRNYANTIIYSILGTVLALVFSCLLAYPLSKRELRANKVVGPFVIFTMYFAAGMIPNYVLMTSLGLKDNVLAFVIPGMISTYYVILMRSFFETVPRELEEAGEIDGLSMWGAFLHVALPLSKPIIATMTLFYLVQYWNNWFDAFLYLSQQEMWPVAYQLRNLISTSQNVQDAAEALSINANIKSCAMVLTAAPIICVYPFIQRYFVQGMMLGGVKG